MQSYQYRVWDTRSQSYVKHVLLAQDGILWLKVEDFLFSSTDPERYIVEFATDHLDTKDAMIYDGDIVYNNMEEKNFPVMWGVYDSCDTWVINPGSYMGVLGYWSNKEREYRNLTIVGNIHETPELLMREEQTV